MSETWANKGIANPRACRGIDEMDILKVRTMITHFEGQDYNHDTQ